MKRISVIVLFVAINSVILMTPTAALGDDNTLSWPIRGFDYPSWWHDEYLDQASDVSLSRIAATGAGDQDHRGFNGMDQLC